MKIDGKKLTVKFVANTRSKPVYKAGEKDRISHVIHDVDLYQIYAQVSYDKMFTEFSISRAGIYRGIRAVPSDFDFDAYMQEYQSSNELIEYQKQIFKIISFEKKHLKDKFKLAGLGYRLDIYFGYLTTAVSSLMDLPVWVDRLNGHASKKNFSEEVINGLSALSFREYADFFESLYEEDSLVIDYLTSLPYRGNNKYLKEHFFAELVEGLLLGKLFEDFY